MAGLLQRMYALRKATPAFLLKRDSDTELSKELPGIWFSFL
jgi:hypothetical protein